MPGWKSVAGAALAALLLTVAACGPKEPPIGELTAGDLWGMGIEAYNTQDWDDAIRYFDRFALVGGSDPRVHQARYYVAEAHFRKDEYVTAAAEYSRLAADLGRTDLADDARFGACRSYEALSPDPQLDQEYTRAAIDHCQALLQYFPDSPHAEQASAIVDRMWEKLAAKAFEGGDWYFRRRAYDSAIIYFDDVVQKYPKTSYAPKALARLVDIYGKLQYEDELQDARQRLLNDYPDSPEARALGGSANADGGATEGR